MKFIETELAGVFEIVIEPNLDERGSFARLYCQKELEQAGLNFSSAQINISKNYQKYTLRGMHYQEPPFAEAKIIRAVRGIAYDVVVDIRPHSKTRLHWVGRTLDANRGNALFVPEGFAHGFLTLEPDTEILYQMGCLFTPGHARGFRYDDYKVGIVWPHSPSIMSEVDNRWPPLK